MTAPGQGTAFGPGEAAAGRPFDVAGDGRTDARPAGNTSAGAGFEARPSDAKPSDGRPADGKSLDGKSSDGKSPEAFRTISEVAAELDLPQHVLRFWETRFTQIRPLKRGGSRRYYRPEDVGLLRGIRHLLYREGYTIKGVQRILKAQGPRFVAAVADGGALPDAHETAANTGDRDAFPDAAAAAAPGHGNAYNSGNGREAAPQRPVTLSPGLARRRAPPASAGPEAPVSEDSREGRISADDAGGPDVLLGAPAGRGASTLGPGDRERLTATLAELLECKRILDQAR